MQQPHSGLWLPEWMDVIVQGINWLVIKASLLPSCVLSLPLVHLFSCLTTFYHGVMRPGGPHQMQPLGLRLSPL